MNYFWNLLKNLNKTILLLPLVFAAISVTMIGSTNYVDSFVFTSDLKVQIAAFILGYVIMAVMVLIDYKALERYEWLIYVGSILFLLTVYIPGLGSVQYGARGWIDLKVAYLQPAEVVKVFFIVLFARYLCRNWENLYSFTGLVKAGIYMMPFVGIVTILPDLGNALVFLVIAAVMIFAAGVDGKLYTRIFAFAFACMPIAYRFMEPHQQQRIEAFLNPSNENLAANYHVVSSKIAIGSGGLFGKGLFQGTQKQLKYLPVQKSDFIFSVIVEELGMVGGLVIIALYALMLYNMSKIAREAEDMFGSLIATGVLAMFFFQIFENIGMTMGLMPVTGITLPFISYGGSSVVTNMLALGLVLNVSMRSKLINF